MKKILIAMFACSSIAFFVMAVMLILNDKYAASFISLAIGLLLLSASLSTFRELERKTS